MNANRVRKLNTVVNFNVHWFNQCSRETILTAKTIRIIRQAYTLGKCLASRVLTADRIRTV